MVGPNYSGNLKVCIKAEVGALRLEVDFAAPLVSVVLCGPSGSGKSTLLDCIAGLRTPKQGVIKVGSETFFNSERLNIPPQKRRIGYVFQKPALFPHLSVRDNVTFGITDWNVQKRKEREEYLLDLLVLNEIADRRTTNLSGGESQRVALARALAPEPKLLLLDEPFSALHDTLRIELRKELKALHKALALPMVLVTHSRDEALALADYAVCIKDGSIIKSGEPSVVLAE